MVATNGYEMRSTALLRAIGDVVRDHSRTDSSAILKAVGDVLRVELEKMRTPPAVTNHVDTSPMAYAVWELAKELRQAVEFQKAPSVTVDAPKVEVAAPQVNFDLGQLTKAIAGVVERAMDMPLPAVNVDTERLTDLIASALESPRLPDVHVDLSELSTALSAQAIALERNAEAMESVGALLSSLVSRVEKLERAVSTPRPPRKLRIVHGDDASEIEEV